jgi:hypothetical protein
MTTTAGKTIEQAVDYQTEAAVLGGRKKLFGLSRSVSSLLLRSRVWGSKTSGSALWFPTAPGRVHFRCFFRR